MEHFFHKYVRRWHQQIKKLEKHIPHREVLTKFFESKNARLAVILIIAAAIPLTVLGVQQIQDNRQLAAGETCENIKMACTGEVKAEKLCAPKGEKIVFSKEDGTSFNMDRYHFGNGAKNCTETGTTVTCDAIGTGGKNKPVTHHTVTRDQIDLCKYGVQWVESTKPKPTARPATDSPQRTPQVGKPTSTPAPNEGFDADLNADGCSANNTPRLKARWDVAKDAKNCKIKIASADGKHAAERSDCGDESLTYIALPRESNDHLRPGVQYTLTVTVDGETKTDNATTASCGGGSSTTAPTQRPGTTRAPTPAGATPTPSKLEPPAGESIKAACGGTQEDPKLIIAWSKVDLAKSYIVNIRTSQGGSPTSETTTKESATFENIEKDKRYFYSVISVDANGKKSEESKVSSDRIKICTNDNLQAQGSAGAGVCETCQ